jgi:hypothetical protein
VGCAAKGPVAGTKSAFAAGPNCQENEQDLVAFVDKLPAETLIAPLSVELPQCSVGGLPGGGAVLEISEKTVVLEGAKVEGRTLAERVAGVRAWSEQRSSGSQAPETLYVAASPEVDVQTLRAYITQIPEKIRLRLLVRAPAAAGQPTSNAPVGGPAERLLAERDPRAREALARDGFAEYSRCASVAQAVQSVEGLGARERWPRLRNAVRAALPGCACSELAPDGLKQMLVAEQRAGTATMAALPLGFLRDERCGASMPLRSIGKLLSQIESFDREFSGDWQKEALEFEQVLTDERLIGYFCNALPGETLAALARARATLYWKVPGAEACEPWRFEPLSPGAPMGTWRRVGADSKPAGLAFHYWQAAEEVRLFGPAAETPPSKPTDHGPWACDEQKRLVSVDASSIELEHGRWFFSPAACRDARAESDLLRGCSAERGAAH